MKNKRDLLKIVVNFLIILWVLYLPSCKCGTDIPGVYRLATGSWRGELVTQGGPLPFVFDLKRKNDSSFIFTLYNSDEQITTEEILVVGDSILIQFPVYEAVLAAQIRGLKGDTLKGQLMRTAFDEVNTIEFSAVAGAKYTFAAKESTKNHQISGKWEALFVKPDSATSDAIGVFSQEGLEVKGTFLTPYGDYRYLSGIVDGDSLFLAGFDAATAYLFKGKIVADSLVGTFFAGAAPGRKVYARKNEAAVLKSISEKSYLLPNTGQFNFKFPSAPGTYVSLQDNKFKNKVVIVQILGTWCHNCLDETALLQSMYTKYANAGLEVVGLAFERTRIEEKAFDNIKKLVKRFSVTYPILLAGSPEPESLKSALPQISEVLGYPTTIVLNRKGEIIHVEVGFIGPSSGALYNDYVQKFEQKIKELLQNEQ